MTTATQPRTPKAPIDARLTGYLPRVRAMVARLRASRASVRVLGQEEAESEAIQGAWKALRSHDPSQGDEGRRVMYMARMEVLMAARAEAKRLRRFQGIDDDKGTSRTLDARACAGWRKGRAGGVSHEVEGRLDGLSDGARELAALMMQGVSGVEAQRQLGISHRAYWNRVRELRGAMAGL